MVQHSPVFSEVPIEGAQPRRTTPRQRGAILLSSLSRGSAHTRQGTDPDTVRTHPPLYVAAQVLPVVRTRYEPVYHAAMGMVVNVPVTTMQAPGPIVHPARYAAAGKPRPATQHSLKKHAKR